MGTHSDIFLIGRVPDHREADNPYSGQAHECREADNSQLALHPPPPIGHGTSGGDFRWGGPVGTGVQGRADVDTPPPTYRR